MISVDQAIKRNLTKEYRHELKRYDKDFVVELDEYNRVYILDRSRQTSEIKKFLDR